MAAFKTSWNDWTSSSEYKARTKALDKRNGDVYLVVHHAVNQLVQQTIALSKPGGRLVSMNFAIGPTRAGVTSPLYCVGVVGEQYRAFTTASSIDDRALTVEVSNINLSATYPVADEAKEWLAQLAAYMHQTYKMPLDRKHVVSHQEVYRMGLGSYPTACPGPNLQSSLDAIVNRAKVIANPPITNQEETVAKNFVDIDSYKVKPGSTTAEGGFPGKGARCLTLWEGGHVEVYLRDPDNPHEMAKDMFQAYGAHIEVKKDVFDRLAKIAQSSSPGGTTPPTGEVTIEIPPMKVSLTGTIIPE